MPVQLTFKGTDKLALAAFKSQAEIIVARLTRQLTASMIKLQAHIQQVELGGAVLQHRTGVLAGSVQVEQPAVVGNELIGGVTAAGGPAWYGQVHQRGGQKWYDIYPVNKKALAFFPTNSLGAGGGITPVSKGALKALYRRQLSGFGKELKPGKVSKFGQFGGVVVAHVHHPPLPKRPFMTIGLEAMRATIVNDLRDAVMGGAA